MDIDNSVYKILRGTKMFFFQNLINSYDDLLKSAIGEELVSIHAFNYFSINGIYGERCILKSQDEVQKFVNEVEEKWDYADKGINLVVGYIKAHCDFTITTQYDFDSKDDELASDFLPR